MKSGQAQMDKRILARVEKAIREKVFPGCVLGIVRKSGERNILPFGASIYGGKEIVEEHTVYDVASITKSIPTASLALLFINEGKLSLYERVCKYLPELKNDHGAKMEDLLRYRVSGVQMSTLVGKTPDEITEHVFERGFDAPVGESKYTNLPAFLLGLIIERVGGKSLNMLAEEYFFKPLNMTRTTFCPNAPSIEQSPTEVDEEGNEVRGVPHDESARVFAKAGHAVGHAGLFSTVPDLLNFLEALLQGKFPYILDGAEKGLGWQVNDKNFMGQYAGQKTFGKTGFTGTSVL